ncbi:MAG: 4-(cytidine 5'-diphospho)-2-C-methyl-D-erythritol kinase [Melioribacteraceae bacterium]|nr:4-(cytidine 5'-diphospho)-2-C-methyl-D-erythritol kinase [Melioribacteraceae bacterium]
MLYIEIKAPAKINIGLKVVSKREDGYHNLSTLFYPIYDLYDILIFEIADNFSFLCNDKSIPSDDKNLVIKAKNILEKETNKKFNVRIELIKNIPSEAGLGGGSSDAAATLISLCELFSLNITNEKLMSLALDLGSDVPFFIKSKPAIGKSRGEILEHIDFEINYPILIVNPKIKISTKEAFEKIIPTNEELEIKSFLEKQKNNLYDYKNFFINDFEFSVFEKFPEIKRIKEIMYENNALFSSMSGTGSTVYGIFNNEEEIKNVISKLPDNYFSFISKNDS